MDAGIELEKHHECPFINGITKYAGSVTMTLVEDMWEKLDFAYEQLLGTHSSEFKDVAFWKGQCRMGAEMIAIFMKPHFQTPDEIVREVVKRKQMRDTGEEYETKGLGYRMYELPKDDNKPRQVKAGPARIVVPSKLSSDDIQMIKFMSGAQTNQTIAELFDITEAEVKAVVTS